MSSLHELLVRIVEFVIIPFRPNTWRWVFTGQTKVRVYLEGGTHVDVFCTKWEVKTRNGKIEGYSFDGPRHHQVFDVTKIIALEQR